MSETKEISPELITQLLMKRNEIDDEIRKHYKQRVTVMFADEETDLPCLSLDYFL
ncbi:MAG: hypothetical protein AB1630_12675 [bacterium]